MTERQVGPSLGSFVVDSVGWPWAFYINLPLGGLSLWLGKRRLQEARSVGASRSPDLIGVALTAAGGALTLPIVQSNSPAWSCAELTGVSAFGAIVFAAFVIWIRGAKAPLVDPQLFHHRTYAFANLATLSFGVAFAMMFFTFFYMTEVWQYSLPRAGLAITPGPLLVVLVAVLAGRIGHRPFLVGGSLLCACSGLWFMLVPGVEPQYLRSWLPGLALSGVAIGLVLPSLSAAAVNQHRNY